MEISFDQAVFDASKAIICRRNKVADNVNGTHQISDWREWQADYLAACLLMPDSSVRNFAKAIKSKYQDIAPYSFRHADGSEHDLLIASLIMEMSEAFQVSSLAAKVRLKQLDLLPPVCTRQIPLKAQTT
jgi:Zn-dependent peptidase ImmA (M78 family)